jgi:hypothetical protein
MSGKEWYLWLSKAQADAALICVNTNHAFPYRGRNAATGGLDGPLVTQWCEAVTQTADGRFGFPRIPSDLMDCMGISLAERAAFIDTFHPQIVVDPELPPKIPPEGMA